MVVLHLLAMLTWTYRYQFLNSGVILLITEEEFKRELTQQSVTKHGFFNVKKVFKSFSSIINSKSLLSSTKGIFCWEAIWSILNEKDKSFCFFRD